jgi:hypothetical protein
LPAHQPQFHQTLPAVDDRSPSDQARDDKIQELEKDNLRLRSALRTEVEQHEKDRIDFQREIANWRERAEAQTWAARMDTAHATLQATIADQKHQIACLNHQVGQLRYPSRGTTTAGPLQRDTQATTSLNTASSLQEAVRPDSAIYMPAGPRFPDNGTSSRGCEDEQGAREAAAIEAAVQAVASCTDSNSAAFATQGGLHASVPRTQWSDNGNWNAGELEVQQYMQPHQHQHQQQQYQQPSYIATPSLQIATPGQMQQTMMQQPSDDAVCAIPAPYNTPFVGLTGPNMCFPEQSALDLSGEPGLVSETGAVERWSELIDWDSAAAGDTAIWYDDTLPDVLAMPAMPEPAMHDFFQGLGSSAL